MKDGASDLTDLRTRTIDDAVLDSLIQHYAYLEGGPEPHTLDALRELRTLRAENAELRAQLDEAMDIDGIVYRQVRA